MTMLMKSIKAQRSWKKQDLRNKRKIRKWNLAQTLRFKILYKKLRFRMEWRRKLKGTQEINKTIRNLKTRSKGSSIDWPNTLEIAFLKLTASLRISLPCMSKCGSTNTWLLITKFVWAYRRQRKY